MAAIDARPWLYEKQVLVGDVTTPAPVETAVVLPPEVALERARFAVGVWHDLPIWRCTACPFDTLMEV